MIEKILTLGDMALAVLIGAGVAISLALIGFAAWHNAGFFGL